MNDRIQKLLEQARGWLNTLSSGQQIGLGVAAGLAVLVAVGFALAGQNDPMQVLYADLEPSEGRAVTKVLGEKGILYSTSTDGAVISVPKSRVHQARMELAKQGLPGQDVVGFEKFDGSTLGMSSYVQRIQYVRAVQGELTRSIQRLDSVKRVRVHISLPPRKTFLEDQEPPKASVVLELHRGKRPSKSEINGIAHLVASGVEGLKVSQVTIVDTRGTFLHRPEDALGSAGVSSAILETQRSIEREYERRIHEILAPITGIGNVRAKVAVEVDPSRVNTTEETFDPDNTVVRSRTQNDENMTGSKPNPIGIPGSRSNLPGAEANNPPIPTANTNSNKNTQTTSYAVPRKVQVTDKPFGGIKRLTVSVIVDGTYEKGAGGAETFVPRPEEEIQRIRDLVANAVGLDQSRRDSLTVKSMPFQSTELGEDPAVETTPIWKDPGLIRMMVAILAALAAFLGIWLLLRRFSTRSQDALLEERLNEGPLTVAQLEAAQSNPLAASKLSVLGEETEPLEKQEEAELKRRIIEKLESAPRKGFAIVEEWVEESARKKAQARLREAEGEAA